MPTCCGRCPGNRSAAGERESEAQLALARCAPDGQSYDSDALQVMAQAFQALAGS